MFVTVDDFHIPPYNLAEAVFADDSPFHDYMERKERDVLVSLLGINLYNELVAYVEGSGEGEPDDVWDGLIEGGEYTLRNCNYQWDGLKAMIVPYVYANWLRDTYENITALEALVIPQSENAKVVNPTRRIVQASADFALKAGKGRSIGYTLFGYLTANKQTFTSWVWSDPDYLYYI